MHQLFAPASRSAGLLRSRCLPQDLRRLIPLSYSKLVFHPPLFLTRSALSLLSWLPAKGPLLSRRRCLLSKVAPVQTAIYPLGRTASIPLHTQRSSPRPRTSKTAETWTAPALEHQCQTPVWLDGLSRPLRGPPAPLSMSPPHPALAARRSPGGCPAVILILIPSNSTPKPGRAH